ncbi:MAG: PD-(D/E)XK nuclease family protein [Candidatus Thermoplasmatota archaeon]|nr:PD-(D/E)XK nuclease family protein [Candidatus Thermoplasmatota archaeon]
MPVQIYEDDDLEVSRFERLSATSLIQYQACPRLWFLRRVEFLKSPSVPAMMRGHIVEATVCRVLRESPILVSEDDDWDILSSPLDENGRPERGDAANWAGPNLTLNEGMEDVESLRAWARARVDVHLPTVKQMHVEAFEDDPMAIGEGADLNDEKMHSMVCATIDLHLEEVERCLAENGGPNLDTWRTGTRAQWPPPDGFPLDWNQPHPISGEGDCSLMEAWEIARPWFVDPDAATFSLGSTHPEHWFWGEYDFVYSWDGDVTIVDLKAAIGNNDRSAGYVKQLEIYAWLWWSTHEKKSQVRNLRIWYAGPPAVKNIPAPDEARLEALDEELRNAYDTLFTNRGGIEDFPATPSPLQIFEDGGKHVGVDDDKHARCNTCDYRSICPTAENRRNLPAMTKVEHGGKSWPITQSVDLKTRINICGEVVALLTPPEIEDDGIKINFHLQQGVDRIEVKNCFIPKPKNISRRIRNGAFVRIKNGRPTEWNLTPSVELDDVSVVEIIDPSEADGEEIIGMETAGNVVGRVMTIRDTIWQKNRTASGKPKWRFTMQDASGRIDVVAYSFAVPRDARSIKPGDEIAVLNGVYSEFFGRPEIKFQKNTRLVILKRRDD